MGRPKIDRTGVKYGKLTAIEPVGKLDTSNSLHWRCKCDCGNETVVRGGALTSGAIVSCGCYSGESRIIDEAGNTYGRLTVIERCKKNSKYWVCSCACGTERHTVLGALLRRGQESCGCLRDERRYEAKVKVKGHAGLTALYNSYRFGARNRRIPWELTRQDVERISQMTCHYCGSAPSSVMRPTKYQTEEARAHASWIYNGLDRVDSNKSYTLDNVVPCCSICNKAKSTLTAAEFLAWVERISRYQKEVANA